MSVRVAVSVSQVLCPAARGCGEKDEKEEKVEKGRERETEMECS